MRVNTFVWKNRQEQGGAVPGADGPHRGLNTATQAQVFAAAAGAVGHPDHPWRPGGCFTGPGMVAGGWVTTVGQCSGTRELFEQQVKPVLS